MTSAAFPTVIAAVVTTATATLPGVRVVRGRDFTNDPGDLVMIGVADPDGGEWESTGSYEQSPHTFGGKRQEIGDINCLAVSRNGDGDPAAALAAVFTLIAAFEASIAGTPTLGLSSPEMTNVEMESGAVQESASDEGASAALSFVITYKARI